MYKQELGLNNPDGLIYHKTTKHLKIIPIIVSNNSYLLQQSFILILIIISMFYFVHLIFYKFVIIFGLLF